MRVIQELFRFGLNICLESEASIIKEYNFNYEGSKPSIVANDDLRPIFIRHHLALRDWNAYSAYTGGDESFTLVSSIGKELGLKKIGIHHEILKPGKRSSWPHAHKREEELVFIISGHADIWVNRKLYAIQEGDSVAFPSGTGITHTFINDSHEDIELIVSGETTKENNRCIFPLNPEMKESMGDFWWGDWPEQEFKKS